MNLFRNDGSSHYVDLTFFGSSSATVSGTGNINVRRVTINKGNSQATTLDLINGGTMTTPTDSWLTLQNGTLRYMRTNPNSHFTISRTTPFIIPATAGLYIDLPSNTGSMDIQIGNFADDNGDLILSGKLSIIRGDVFVGEAGGADVTNNDIEYTSSGSSSIDVQGGTLFVNGQIRRNPSNAGGILKYSQTGGTVTINGRAANTTNAKLEVLNSGSEFNMSNGTLTIARGNDAFATPSTPFGDLYLRPTSGSVTGGSIVFTQGGTEEQNYYLDADIALNHLTITGGAQPATLRLLVSPLVLNGNMNISANSILNSNNIDITFNGNLNNTPGVGGYVYGTNNTTFSATNGSSYVGAQTINGATDFYDLTVSPGTSLTLTNPTTINRNLDITSGNFKLGSNIVNLKGNLTNNGTFTDNDNDGEGITLNGTSQHSISGTGAYDRLILDNAAVAQMLNDITLQEDLTMTTGILDIKKYLLTLGTGAYLNGAPFSTAKMITSDGVFSNVGIRKFFPIIAATTNFQYPLGTSGKYTPADLKIDISNSVGSIRVNNINTMHPSVEDPANALDYYWEIQSSGITNFTGEMVLNYYQEDVIGDEPNYKAARIEVPGTTWSLTNTVDDTNNKITENYTASNNLSGEYTAGITTAFYNNVPEFTSISDGDWDDPTIWDHTGGDAVTLTGGPDGYIVIVQHDVTLNKNYCEGYRTTISGTLRVVSPFFGHNLGTVSGNGKLYLESGSFPAGVFTNFLACSNNATIEYGGSGTYTIIADLYDNISNVIFSGTGTRVLPNKDLTICNLLHINGPTLDNSVFNKKLTIQGTMTLESGSFKSGSGAGATVSFGGGGLQTIGDAVKDYFTGSNSFNNLEINNSSGLSINDDGAIEVKGNLLLTSGLINTSATRKLTITNSAINCVIPAGGSVNSFVDGPLIKRISQFDNFLFPIGKSGAPNTLGNNIKISSTQSGPLLWSAEYFTPNLSAAFKVLPLLGVSAQEYYTVKTTSGAQATLNLSWTPNSDVTPLITGGLSNIRLSRFDTGILPDPSWVEIPTISVGNNSNGTSSSTVFVVSSVTGSDNYTLGSITDLKPRAKLSPAGSVCGTSGIPVTFTAPYPITFDYILSYTEAGTPKVVTITSADLPYSIPTPVPGVYALTDFTYNTLGTPKTGVVDAGTVTVYPVPTAANAGSNQTLCGITTTNLAANTPGTGTGEWDIVTELSGPGGTVITPTSPTSQFIGLNGNSYTLRWTVSSGTCTSTDDVVINFTILPTAPAAASAQSFCGSQVFSLTVPVATPPTG
ncbi:MAG: hypothetical protein IPN68_16940 [Bacteroidetes bacterium]|nr:hypothetical protein [Bacteroidota bacterium]